MSNKEKQEDAEPDGVSGAFTTPDGKTVYVLEPFLKNMCWKGITADSRPFKQLVVHERFYRNSLAFLNASSVLCEEAAEKATNTKIDIEWSKANVCYYCLHLATELFLKACLYRLDQKIKNVHDVPDLLKAYKQKLPGEEFFFLTLWFLSPSDLDEIAGGEVLRGVDRKPDQLYRYGMDQAGNPSQVRQSFTPGYIFNYVQYLLKRWPEIWEKLHKN